MISEWEKELPKNTNPIPDIPTQGPCTSPYHRPPMHLWIPPGKTYEHVCPVCGRKTVLSGGFVHF